MGQGTVRQAAKWLVVIWHLWVLAALVQALDLMRPLQQHFRRPSAWRPLHSWLRTGAFFHFATGRAAVAFLLIVLAAGILVFLIYFFDDRVRGWIAMLIWNGLGAYNYYGSRLQVLYAIFLAGLVLTVLSGPLIPRWRRRSNKGRAGGRS